MGHAPLKQPPTGQARVRAAPARQRQIFCGEGRRQQLDHAGILDPAFHHVEAASAALATVALPAFALSDRCDLFLRDRGR
jgi:hypothetical protein